MPKLYVAYGSNCNIVQMHRRCVDSDLIDTGFIMNYQLKFKGVATIVPKKKSKVPITCWRISDRDELALDAYEGVKNNFYRKEIINVNLDSGDIVEAMVYILNSKEPDFVPNSSYIETILEGYKENDLDIKYLLKAYERSFNSEKKSNPKWRKTNEAQV